ncbi:FAD-dependent oxidoreductase [Photobacterium profundum]|uniref:Possible monoamine oxidase n=1 Tax=Photobacterium profundum 3TCK TaxID=314280 RepID=Q1ZA14_9GAMM|nr:FAD-dependent oxidoreductase [Photobacterium profundum]EAS45678.1 possible monoamine oxidase [Photobacterium profundum 3TCK]PSV63173.1 FAD-dependent oxidoreductase [Photobacterium profundum]
MKTDFIIVGAGLSGLYAALQLEKLGKDYVIVEGRDRVGGRIYSESVTTLKSTHNDASLNRVDMGPSWFWPSMHPRITQLIDDLLLPVFPQYAEGAYMFDNDPTTPATRYEAGLVGSPISMRVAGGMQTVIDGVKKQLPAHKVYLQSTVKNVVKTGVYSHVTLAMNDDKQVGEMHTTDMQIIAKNVIFAMPLRLIAESVQFQPALPVAIEKAFASTPTWMAAHAKFFAVYDKPFWRNNGLSGSASSRVGPLVDIHDASTFGGVGVLFGFVGIDATTRISAGDELIKSMAVSQLARIFGEQAASPIDVKLVDWSQQAFTATTTDQMAPASHPSYGLPRNISALNDLGWYFAGTEAAVENGGYIEGALEAAEEAVRISVLDN